MRHLLTFLAAVLLIGCSDHSDKSVTAQNTTTSTNVERRCIDHRQELDDYIKAVQDDNYDHIRQLEIILSELRDVEKQYPKDERIKDIADELEILIDESSIEGRIDDIKSEIRALDWE